ncbi:acylphosphatase-1-like [Diorhabda carinulata]|uniref:acylphosphatase-1-like n=1 Tax=Diorhabda carinulata TaxID=1163345 RepID=UPI0025A199E9|nr:acylphosphatase-1-like [Diorhabda carinulata]
MSSEKLISLEFEIFGKVQGVYFRKYTERAANRLDVKGWCTNTDQNTVKGMIQGNSSNIESMKNWLEKTGSPRSKIEKAVFCNEKEIEHLTYDSFKIVR